MRRPLIVSNTMYSLEATEYAQQQRKFEAFHLAAYKAYWEEGKNLGELAVIQQLAVDCGLDWPELSERLDSGFYRGTILSQFQQAVDMGIQGIPAFLVGNQLFVGAQPYEIFKMAADRARESMEKGPGNN